MCHHVLTPGAVPPCLVPMVTCIPATLSPRLGPSPGPAGALLLPQPSCSRFHPSLPGSGRGDPWAFRAAPFPAPSPAGCPVPAIAPLCSHRGCSTERGHGGLLDPPALSGGPRLLVSLRAFNAGNSHCLSQADIPALGPWRRAPAALPALLASLPSLGRKTPQEQYVRTHVFPWLR